MRSLIFVTLISMFAANVVGYWGGINVGVAMAAEKGPRAACLSIRFPMFVCEKMPE